MWIRHAAPSAGAGTPWRNARRPGRTHCGQRRRLQREPFLYLIFIPWKSFDTDSKISSTQMRVDSVQLGVRIGVRGPAAGTAGAGARESGVAPPVAWRLGMQVALHLRGTPVSVQISSYKVTGETGLRLDLPSHCFEGPVNILRGWKSGLQRVTMGRADTSSPSLGNCVPCPHAHVASPLSTCVCLWATP